MDLDERPPRMVIEEVRPQVDCGRFPAKRVVGEEVEVEASVFADGHEAVAARLLFRREPERDWSDVPMESLGNDRWRAAFRVSEIGIYRFMLEGWPAPFETWRRDTVKKRDAGQDVGTDLLVAAGLLEAAAERARDGAPGDAARLDEVACSLRRLDGGRADEAVALALEEEIAEIVARHPDRSAASRYDREPAVLVERERAGHGAWYEMFPRSCGDGARHGTLRDCEARLPYVASMGFDVLYLPPIHPIGRTNRKGANNALECRPEDPGSPWAIGSADGGHMAVHRELGTVEDFRRLVARAREHGLEIALDIAFQCSPDHPWVREHPSWFRSRPDGRIRYAENPPKSYEDIYPLDFETRDWRALWEELRGVFLFWSEQGVTIFRVDNPHTKPFRFWEWVIREVRREHPEAIFLSEAFTRPSVMRYLAKLGFSQSYTYFTWRNTAWELRRYMEELTGTEAREYFRPNLWTNTPDILNEYLQTGGRPAFAIRLILAATLGASYGIYGPAMELCEARPLRPGSEEYLDSEKYQVREWNRDDPSSLRDLVARINRIRREIPALRTDRTLRFHDVDNDFMLCYSKTAGGGTDDVLVAVNLDPHHTQSGWVHLDLEALGLEPGAAFQVHDLLGDARYLWEGSHNYVELDPHVLPAHLFRIRRRHRSEKDFDYFQ